MAELIGLALAIVPLVVSAPEHYSTAAKVIKRYRLYTSKREELISKARVQRAIFNKTIWRLLAYDVGLGEDEASQMLADAEYTGWSDAETRSCFEQRMADVGDELLGSIRMINDQLSLLNVDNEMASMSILPAISNLQTAFQVRFEIIRTERCMQAMDQVVDHIRLARKGLGLP